VDDTRTATLSIHSAEQGEPLGLVIAYHPDPRYIGSARVVASGERLVLGRTTEDFAPGAFHDGRISRKHVTIGRLGQTLSVRDLESRNGTYVNGRRFQHGPLSEGDVLAMGHLILLVRTFPRDAPALPSTRMVGSSVALARALDLVDRVATHDQLPVLVLGESGTGKELVAREVHARSGRQGAFVAVNCAGMAETLLLSELFGHVRGAYSGADRARKGLVEQARSGTLFLDELGDATLTLQASLLRLLQEKEIRPVGSDRSLRVDVRFVAATNRDLKQAVHDGSFREDLYARLNRMVVRLPPLRDRREDILPLAIHFAQAFAGKPVRVSFPLAQALLCHDWPGNARSLQAVMERLVLEFGDLDELPAPGWLSQELSSHARRGEPAPAPAPEIESAPDRVDLDALDLMDLLRRHRGNVSSLAQHLGVGRNTLYRWLKRRGIDLEAVRSDLDTPTA
jgi:transcriptional regulator with PAS, ATPase and Fis domain